MANIAHNLRIPEADSGHAAPTGRGWGGFSLVAERATLAAARAGAVSSPLFARTPIPSGALPRACDLVPERSALPPLQGSRRAIVATIVAALALHLLVIAPLIPLSAPTPDDDATHRIGMETGEPLNVSVISVDDLKRLSSDPLKQQGSAAPEPAPPAPPQPEVQAEPTPPEPAKDAQQSPQQQEQKPEPVPQEQKTASASPLESKSDEKERPFDPESYAVAATKRFSQQLDQAFQKPQQRNARRQATRAGNVKAFRPGASSSGKSNEFERAVIWALAATKPMGNGKWGSVVVTFAVGERGRVDGLRLMKSSGDNWLDQGALMAVRQARLPAPPSGLPPGDRTFVVEYISMPGL
ncbi:TonB family protein [Rhodomicrobium sp. Az07]|uniref:energy transducer TonB family protein n=1 Tax=Rhodomicrobium sp. Az07 TaxID=2839034 RepID=UPI001BEA001A|nr:TonB family protein [Rhodomicrobium sp. Az07]MBT3071801.1 TonB family protein [Rhodomicrobium sp. Az07]